MVVDRKVSKRALDKRGFDSHQPPHLFVNGVEKDSNFPEGTVYIFKKQLCVEDEVYQIYIKIKYVEKKITWYFCLFMSQRRVKEMYELKKPKERLFCEQCGKLVRYKTIKKRENYNVKNYPIEVERTVAICEECGTELLEPYYENENLKAAYRKYAELNNLVLPEEIKEIRSKYNVSQTLFALILGLGEATIQRYEMGSLPTKVNSDLIKRVSEPVEFYKILKSNKDNIPDIEYKRILGNIHRILKEFENKLEVQENV